MLWTQRLFGRRTLDLDLAEEMQQHLQERADNLVASGMTQEEALQTARREFGNMTLLQEQGREVWKWPGVEDLLRDLRYALRRLRQSPGLTVTCVATLALGLGATVALFSVVRAVLLKPLPFRDPERLVMLYETSHKSTGFAFNVVAGGNFTEWQRRSHSFEQMAFWGYGSRNLSGAGGQLAEKVQVRLCTWNLFQTLGVQPAYGRFFAPEDDQPGANATTVLTWGLFTRRFGGDPSVIGKTVLLDDKAYTVIGILPEWFAYPDTQTQLWTPAFYERPSNVMQSHGMHMWNVVARLKPGVSPAAARAEVDGIQREIHRQYPNEPAQEDAELRPLIEDIVHDFKTPLYVLLGAVGCVLLITCLNVANLLVARSAARRKELSVRAALGGSRWRLIQEQTVESLVLAFAGGSLAVALATAAMRWVAITRTDLPRSESIGLDIPVLLFAFTITLVTGIAAGLIPALSSLRSSLLSGLTDSSRSFRSSRSQTKLRKVLLGTEVAFTVVLLVCAGLLVKSFFQLRAVRLGCATKNILTMRFALPQVKYSKPAQVTAFFEQLTNTVRSLPGVENAGLISTLPGGGYWGDNLFTIPEHPPLPKNQFQFAIYRGIDPQAFSTLQLPVLRGRSFTNAERFEKAHYTVVSQSFAQTYFRGEDPLGKHIRVSVGDNPANYEIVGVVGDTPFRIGLPVRPMMYFPLYEGDGFREASLVVRVHGDPLSLALPIQKLIARMDPNLAMADILTLDQVIGKSTAEASFDTVLIGGFATLSLLLAAVGLYGVLSYIVTQRTGELGIRIALGARRPELLRLALFDGMRPAVIGLIFGLLGGLATAQTVRSMLFGVKTNDATILFAVPLVLLMVAAAACAIPAWRASSIDPVIALRTE